MSEAAKLLQEIELFLSTRGMKPGTFGRKAVNDGKLVRRLRSGRSVRIETAHTIRSYIQQTEARV